jgi:enoyl-CoA hydratase
VAIHLDLEREGPVLTVTFARPEARNALNRETRVALVDLLDDADRDPSVRVVVVTGSEPAFSAGVDAKQLLSDPAYAPPPIDPATRLRGMATPTIAAVNGACVSGAIEIVLACSFAIASHRAEFIDTHALLGLTPGWGLSAALPAAIGVARARQMTLTGLPIDARTALAWGLVNEVVDHSQLRHRVRRLAERIAGTPVAAATNAVGMYRAVDDDGTARARQRERDVSAAWEVEAVSSQERFTAGNEGS